MKKNKSKPKSKPKTFAVNPQQNQSVDDKCAVCRFQLKDKLSIITCDTCHISAHSSCYNSQSDINHKKPFNCDVCLYWKQERKRPKCQICGLNETNQMLRRTMGTGSDMKFVHIECAIISSANTIQIQSYSKMSLQWVSSPEMSKYSCRGCGSESKSTFVQCVECQKKGHFACWIIAFGEDKFYYMISRWLEKCQKYDFLLYYILSKKKTNLKGIIDLPPKCKEGAFVVCSEHDKTYPFCYCNSREETKNRKYEDYQCNLCGRWVHQTCSGLPPDSPIDLHCQGCKNNDIFKKQLKPNQLLTQISRLQKLNIELDEIDIRLLNAFPFKYSSFLHKKIEKCLKSIQAYFAKREIINMCQEKSLNQRKKRKFNQLLLILTYGDKWKQRELQMNKENEQSQQIKAQILKFLNVKFEKEVEQKIISMYGANLKNSRKESKQIQNLKQCLKNFLKQWRQKSMTSSTNRASILQLAYTIKQVQNKFLQAFLHNPQEQKIFLDKFNLAIGNDLFGLLISRPISGQLINYVLRKYSRLKYYESKKIQISQPQYRKFLNQPEFKIHGLELEVWRRASQILRGMLQFVGVSYQSVQKEEKYKRYETHLKQNILDNRVFKKCQTQALKQNICTIDPQNSFFKRSLKHSEQNILKKKILRMCSIRQQSLNQSNFRDIARIEQFIRKNNTIFSSEQLSLIHSYLGKIEFLQFVLRKGQHLQHYAITEDQCVQNGYGFGIVFAKLFHILQFWDDRLISGQAVISEMCSKLATKKARFNNQQVNQRLKNLVRHITSNILSMIIDQGRKIIPSTLRKISKVLNYFGLQREYPLFIQMMEKYKKWANIFVGEEQPINLSNYLDKPDKASNLAKIIDSKLTSAHELDKINLNSEINKLCVLRQWCRLSQKMGLLSKSKATINAIQTLKFLLDKCQYPTNVFHKKIVDLDNQGKNINREAIKFLEKPKYVDHMGFYEEIKFINNKLTLSQGYAIKALMDKCNLDFYMESQQLESQIKQFQMFPTDFNVFTANKNYTELGVTRKKLIDSSFRVPNIQDYQNFLRRLYILRCNNFEPPVRKQQYFELLTVCGNAAIQFEQKTSQLLYAYKTIQKAEQELTKARPNQNNLIPWSQQRLNQIKSILKLDPTEFSKFEKARANNAKVRDQYHHLRNKKYELEKYKDVQMALQSSIFNNKDLLTQIFMLRNEVYQIVRKVEEVLGYGLPVPRLESGGNIFKRERGLLDIYNNLRIKHPSLEKFQHDCRFYWRAQQLRIDPSINNYLNYIDCCSRISDIGCRIPQFLAARSEKFFEVLKFLKQPQENLRLFINKLISEGLQLKRLDSFQKNFIFETVFELYERLKYLERQDQEDDDEQQNEIQDEGRNRRRRTEDLGDDDDEDQVEDDEDMDGQEDQDEEDDEDQDDQDEDQGKDLEGEDHQSSSEYQDSQKDESKGKNNEIVLDSD